MGRPIAAKLSELLNVEYYDREIVEQTARQLGENVSSVSEEEEKVKTKFGWMKVPFGVTTTEKQDTIFIQEQRIIEQFAAKQSCIIVGRCSDYILRDRKNALHIYIYAPFEARLRNCVDILKIEEQEARKTIQEVDKMRDSYHKTYAGFLPGNPAYKSMSIDSSVLGINGTAKYIAQLANERFQLGLSL